MKPLCFLDVDGVVCDFVKGALAFHGKTLEYATVRWDFYSQLGLTEADFWTPLQEDFWAGLEATAEKTAIVQAVEEAFGPYNVFLLTSPCLTPGCATGKARWVEKHLPGYARRLLLTTRKEVFAGPGRTLIDDSPENVAKWKDAGGQTVLVPRPWNDLRAFSYCSDDVVAAVRQELSPHCPPLIESP